MPFIDFQQTGTLNASGATINPAQDETLILLRRLVQLSQTLAVQDASNRQRVTVDVLPTLGTVNNIGALAGIDVRWQFMEQARISFATGIRSKIS